MARQQQTGLTVLPQTDTTELNIQPETRKAKKTATNKYGESADDNYDHADYYHNKHSQDNNNHNRNNEEEETGITINNKQIGDYFANFEQTRISSSLSLALNLTKVRQRFLGQVSVISLRKDI